MCERGSKEKGVKEELKRRGGDKGEERREKEEKGGEVEE